MNVKEFEQADYFLVGFAPGFAPGPNTDASVGKIVYGWLPRLGAELWNTRQALEVNPQRQPNHCHAHKFSYQNHLREYFAQYPEGNFTQVLDLHKDTVVLDTCQNPPTSGQTLRDIVLTGEERDPTVSGLVTTQIGYSGGSVGAPVQNTTLAQIQAGSKHVELFFLVDATKSMGPSLKAAADVSEKIVNELTGLKLNMHIQAAVYRDFTEGNEKFVMPARIGDAQLAGWLRQQAPYSCDDTRPGCTQTDVDYEEALYLGIQNAVSFWKDRFKHPWSVRLLVILGDAGDNGRSGLRLDDLAAELRKYRILPLAVHFQHACTKPEDPQRCADEQKSWRLFITSMQLLKRSVWGGGFSESVPSLGEKDIGKELRNEN